MEDSQLDFDLETTKNASINAPPNPPILKRPARSFMTADQLTTESTSMSILKNRKSYHPSSGRSFIQPGFSKHWPIRERASNHQTENRSNEPFLKPENTNLFNEGSGFGVLITGMGRSRCEVGFAILDYTSMNLILTEFIDTSCYSTIFFAIAEYFF